MPRRDRRFTSDDIIRLMCSNLTGYEYLKARLRIAFDPCDDIGGFCGYVKDILKVCGMAAVIDDSGALKLIGRIPYIGNSVAAIVGLLSTLEPYFELTNEIICKGGGELGTNQNFRSISVEAARRIVENATGRDEVESQIARVEAQENEVRQIEYNPVFDELDSYFDNILTEEETFYTF